MKKKNWKNVTNFPGEWSGRTKLAADLIEESWNVIEFGAGAAHLGKYLKATQRYQPTDLIARNQNFQIIDLNDPLNLGAKFEVGIAMGVFEYVQDIDFTLNELSGKLPNLIATYCSSRYSILRFKFLRKYVGWINHFTEKEIIEIIRKVGYKVEYISVIETRFFYRQIIFKLKKIHG